MYLWPPSLATPTPFAHFYRDVPPPGQWAFVRPVTLNVASVLSVFAVRRVKSIYQSRTSCTRRHGTCGATSSLCCWSLPHSFYLHTYSSDVPTPPDRRAGGRGHGSRDLVDWHWSIVGGLVGIAVYICWMSLADSLPVAAQDISTWLSNSNNYNYQWSVVVV